MNSNEWLHEKIAEAVKQKLAEQDTYCAIIKGFQAIEATAVAG